MIDTPSVRWVAGVLLLVGLLLSIQIVPEWQTRRASVRSSAVNPEAKTTPEQVANLQNEYRKTFIQVVGGLFAFVALVFTYRRVRVAEQGHITDRYTKAIEQLGALTADNKPNVEVRLGAIYALERIAFDSPRDHWPIMEVLTAYVRQNAPAPAQEKTKQEHEKDAKGTTKETEEPEIANAKKPATEIQAILTVLGRRKRDRKREGNGQHLDLSNSDLRGADFLHAHLEGTWFDNSYLERAVFDDAHLETAWFGNAYLKRANFSQAYLRSTKFYRAHLEGADFILAQLERAEFSEAHLDDASFFGANLDGQANLDYADFEGTGMNEVNFSGAHLTEADFTEAHLAGANFDEAHLNNANFVGAHDLTVGQFANSVGVDQAHFDEAFRRELEAAKEAAIKAAAGNDTTPKDTHPTEE